MKILKYTFTTPLHGSIDCSDVLPDQEYVELDAKQMCNLYFKYSALEEFLTSNREDHASCMSEDGLFDFVIRAEVGHAYAFGGRLYLATYIYTDSELSDERIAEVQEWIAGQMSDGWGEGLEQRAWKKERVNVPKVYFDEDSLEFEVEEDEWYVHYYVHPWNSQDFSVYLTDCEELDVELPEVVASIRIPSCRRDVLKFKSVISFQWYLRLWKRHDVLDYLSKTPFEEEAVFYATCDYINEKLADKWAYELGDYHIVYDFKEPPVSGPAVVNLDVNNAIARLLA